MRAISPGTRSSVADQSDGAGTNPTPDDIPCNRITGNLRDERYAKWRRHMVSWLRNLRYDPIQPLLESNHAAVTYFANRDLMDGPVPSIVTVWELPEVKKIVKKQKGDGAWESRNKKKAESSAVNYNLVETWRQFRILAEQYEMNRNNQCVEKAAGFLLACQTDEGDIRGFLADQYAMYYTGAIIALLIKAGYEDDPRIEKGFRWLLSTRQKDGGWVGTPVMTLDNISWAETVELTSRNRETVREWDRTGPLCLNSTGMIIRAFAVHTKHRKSEAARTAAQLLKQHFFMENYYTSYKHKDHWLVFQYPYWWNNLVSALDAISLIYPGKQDRDIQKAVDWIIDHQEQTGLWKVSYSRIHKSTVTPRTKEQQLWITLTICRILKRIFSSS